MEEEGIPVHSHRFTLRPYSMEPLGLWMALAGLLLPVAALGHWGWGGRRLHSALDVPRRVDQGRLVEVVAVLSHMSKNLDAAEDASNV